MPSREELVEKAAEAAYYRDYDREIYDFQLLKPETQALYRKDMAAVLDAVLPQVEADAERRAAEQGWDDGWAYGARGRDPEPGERESNPYRADQIAQGQP